MIERRTAIHEAAHAVAAYLLGFRLRGIVCHAEGEGNSQIFSDSEGYTSDYALTHPVVKATICVALAGYAAARQAGYSEIRHAAGDIKDARRYLNVVDKKTEFLNDEQFYYCFSDDARAFVAHPLRWKVIEALATQLQEVERMSGKEVVKFIEAEASKLSATEQLEFYFPADGLGGNQLNLKEHGG